MGFNPKTGEFTTDPFIIPDKYLPTTIDEMPVSSVSYINEESVYVDKQKSLRLNKYDHTYDSTDVIETITEAINSANTIPHFARLFRLTEGYVLDLTTSDMDQDDDMHWPLWITKFYRAAGGEIDRNDSDYHHVMYAAFTLTELGVIKSALETSGINVYDSELEPIVLAAMQVAAEPYPDDGLEEDAP